MAVELNWQTDEARCSWLKGSLDNWLNENGGEEASAEDFLSEMKLFNPTRPILWRRMATSLNKIWRQKFNKTFDSETAAKIHKWGELRMKAQSSESLYEPGQAPSFSRTDMTPVWEAAYSSEKANRTVGAIVSYICFATGARTGEITSLYIQDLRCKENEGLLFLQMPLRTSKGNPGKERREVITMPTTGNAPVDIEKWVKTQIGDRKEGRVFEYMTEERRSVWTPSK